MQDEMQQLIAKDLGIENLSSEQQRQVISEFGVVALQAATLAIVEQLPEDKREEFGTLSKSGDAGALQAFLDANAPDHENIAKQAVARELARFKDFQASAA